MFQAYAMLKNEIKGSQRFKSQKFQNASIELKFINNDIYDILSIFKTFWNSFDVIKESQRGQMSSL